LNTDLYIGAVNLFKCTLTPGSTAAACNNAGAAPNTNWMNLTHVFGCAPIAAPAHVHPDQHGVDFIVSSGKAVMYFANDGGIYRALDGYTGLAAGSCSGTNLFDNLNGTMGATTQFVSFSQHPTNPDILLGGTQDNGSPVTNAATTSSLWFSVNGGDGGYNEINPNNTSEWFATNTDVSIQRCTSGTACLGQLFPYVIDPSARTQVAGDHGAFYTPYILDPLGPSTPPLLIVGTCRVWRGLGDGTGSGWAPAGSALSFNFEDGTGAAPCPSDAVNMVRGLAAGGPKDANGSTVIYAATDGTGPGAGASGGQIFVSTNASGGIGTWTNISAGISNNFYPLSWVAIDPADPSGHTAYVTVQGFGVPHVWKTTTAGAAWTDFTGTGLNALPDAPANTVMVDAGTVYVGTDVGVFSSPTSAASWAEVGPAPASGTPGYIPAVPVTQLRIFNSGGNKLLRASTHGRGVWEFPLAVSTTPGFSLTATSAVTFTKDAGQSAAFTGTLTAVNGYNGSVTITCQGAPTSVTCTPSPNPAAPATGGTAFLVTLSDATAGIYNFNIQATDGTLTHSVPVKLTVVDFAFAVSGASSATVSSGQTGAFTLNFAPLGGTTFPNSVTYSCANITPANSLITCGFNPASPLAAGSAATNVTLSAKSTGFNSTQINLQGRYTRNRLFLPLGMSVFGVVLAGLARNRRFYQWKTAVAVSLTMALIGVLVACSLGNNSAPPPPPPPVSVTVSAANPAPFINQTDKFTSVVSNATNTQVTWSVSGAGCSGATCGTIDATGLYTAPAAVPNPAAVTVTATSQQDTSKSGSATVTVQPTPPVSVTVSAANPTPFINQTDKFTAVVSNATNTQVTWGVSGAGCTGAACGTIDATGLYTAPATVPNPATVTVIATSQQDTTKTGSSTVTVKQSTPPTTYTITVTATDGTLSHNATVTLTVN
jgi:hypothetical protein